LIPAEGQLLVLDSGAAEKKKIFRMGLSPKDENDNRLIRMKFPSITDPCRWKYQEIALIVLLEQLSMGVNP
jgi:hypothetical protein